MAENNNEGDAVDNLEPDHSEANSEGYEHNSLAAPSF
jgi:hypothetical protein